MTNDRQAMFTRLMFICSTERPEAGTVQEGEPKALANPGRLGEVSIEVRFPEGSERDALNALDEAYREARRKLSGAMVILVPSPESAED